MVQEFHVLKCFQCDTFQVHIVKKAKHWNCKICNAKQSFVKNYGSGTAKECRLHVQELNKLRILKVTEESTSQGEPSFEEEEEEQKEEDDSIQLNSNKKVTNKWSKYIEDDESENVVRDYEEETDVKYVLELSTTSSNRKRKYENISKCASNKENSILKEEEIPCASSDDVKYYSGYEVHDLNSSTDNFESPKVERNVQQTNTFNKWSKYVDDESLN